MHQKISVTRSKNVFCRAMRTAKNNCSLESRISEPRSRVLEPNMGLCWGRLKNKKTGKFSGAGPLSILRPEEAVCVFFSPRGRFFEKSAILGTIPRIPRIRRIRRNGVTARSTNPGNRARAFRITVVEHNSLKLISRPMLEDDV